MPRRIRDIVPIVESFRDLVVGRVVIEPSGRPLEDILTHHPRLLVAMNHGPVAGPLPALIALIHAYGTSGGSDRIPLGVTWRHFYRIPGIKQIATLLTQIDHGAGFDECCSLLRDGPFTDLVLMPEGTRANLGDGSVVQEFRTPRFVELAARAGCPILLGAHVGTEAWAMPIAHQPWWNPALAWFGELGKQIESAGGINVSLPRGRLDAVYMAFDLYQPEATARALGGPEDALSEAVRHDAAAVRGRLNELVEMLRLDRSSTG